jgi:hypothetical protein
MTSLAKDESCSAGWGRDLSQTARGGAPEPLHTRGFMCEDPFMMNQTDKINMSWKPGHCLYRISVKYGNRNFLQIVTPQKHLSTGLMACLPLALQLKLNKMCSNLLKEQINPHTLPI